ncbi:MAG TPA: IS5 family transposase [Anaerolineales bacterium]|nr:IS5 family transposase [Anaerolineales bacterium]
MRGDDGDDTGMWSYVSQEQRIPADHPLRPIRKMVDEVLDRLSPRFDKLYSRVGRPSIPPERLLRALLIQVLYTIRSERLLMEQLDYNMLFRWFVGLSMDDPIWDPTVFTKNRQRLLEGEIAEAFFTEVLALASEKNLTSDEHFTVDGTLIEAWAGQKSFRKRPQGSGKGPDDPGASPGEDFHGEARTNATHQSTTDPQAKLYRKGPGKEAKLCYMGHVLMENRNGLVVDARLTQATGTAEREAAQAMVRAAKRRHRGRLTVGGDKGFDTQGFVAGVREMGVTAHVAQNKSNRRSAIDGRTTRHKGYEVSQWKRKLIEQVFGWMKTVGALRKTRHRGAPRVGWVFIFSLAAFDLLRIRNLEAQVA